MTDQGWNVNPIPLTDMRATYKGRAERAAQLANEVAGSSLAEVVGNALRSRVCDVRVMSEVMQRVRLLDPALAARFWRMAGTPTRGDDAAIVELVAAVRALEPEPAAVTPRPVVPGARDVDAENAEILGKLGVPTA